jgi:hypothetical protein
MLVISCMFVYQDEYLEALKMLNKTLTFAYKVNTDLKFEVFIHKVDGISDDNKMELQRDIHQRASDDLAEAGLEDLRLRLLSSCCLLLFNCRILSVNTFTK